MAPQSFITEWNAETGVLRAVSPRAGDTVPGGTPPPEADGETSIGFRTVASLAFTHDGGVCAVDVPDIPERVAPAIPVARGQGTVGFAWLDSGWLWIPLNHGRAARQRSGLAEVELRLRRDEVTGLSLRFLDQGTGT
ncbi:hypothetical protein [Streptomyces sp. NPDC058330]|uniref:hypothetical protein n=1 Tax=Streptomyces sp. NPDC058330 TaxID=3346449 RepID=UPI0036E94B27